MIGIDIEDISRFREMNFNENKPFFEKVFTSNEIDYCLSKPKPYQHFATRFCAKEAFVKATGKKIMNLKDIEVSKLNDQPIIRWNEIEANLSMSHDADKAIALVMLK